VTDTTTAPTGAPAAAPASPAPASTPAIREAGSVSPASLFEPGKVPPANSQEFLRGSMAAALIERGKMSEAEARAHLAGQSGNAGAPPIDAAPAETPAAVNDGPASYTEGEALIRGQEITNVLRDPEVAGMHHDEAKLWGTALARALANPHTNEQRAITHDATMRALKAAYPDNVQDIIETAREELDHLSKTVPAFKNLKRDLEISGAGNDLKLILTLARRGADRAAANITRGLKRP
jgi:hypothetical protein